MTDAPDPQPDPSPVRVYGPDCALRGDAVWVAPAADAPRDQMAGFAVDLGPAPAGAAVSLSFRWTALCRDRDAPDETPLFVACLETPGDGRVLDESYRFAAHACGEERVVFSLDEAGPHSVLSVKVFAGALRLAAFRDVAVRIEPPDRLRSSAELAAA